MTACIFPTERIAFADPLDVFMARCNARVWLFDAAEFDFYEAVDGLQAAAARAGLIDQLGQDQVQAIMAEAFTSQTDPDKPAEDEEPTSSRLLRTSTRQAAEWLYFQVKDPQRLNAWLMEHSKEERDAIIAHLAKKEAAR
jgi:hypothetical protein